MSETSILTRRLVLTELSENDAPGLFEYRSEPAVRRFQTFEPQCLDDARRFIEAGGEAALGSPGPWHQLGIRLRESGELVGDLGIHFPVEQPHQAEIGFTVAPEHQRRGIATEAVSGLLAHLFERLGTHRVFASVDPRNAASMALLEHLGLRREAHFRESLWFKGEWADDVVFAILKSEWQHGAP